MKIACLLPSLQKKGPVIVALDILVAVKPYVESFDFFYFSENVDEIDRTLYKGTKFTKIEFFRAFDFKGYDVLHSHSLRPDIYTTFFRKRIKPRLITTVHNYVHKELSYTYNKTVSYIFSKLWIASWKCKDVIVFLSHHMKGYYHPKYLTGKKMAVVYNGLHPNSNNNHTLSCSDEKLMNDIISLKLRYKFIGGCGSLNKRKGFEDVIRFLSLNTSIAGIIIGNGSELDNLQQYARDLGVDDRCFFLGFRDDVLTWMKLLDFYIMSSYSEGFPLVMLEAASLKIPILCVDNALFKELFSSEEVIYYKRNDELSMNNSLHTALKDKKKYSNNIYVAVNERYSSEHLGFNYLELYRELVESK